MGHVDFEEAVVKMKKRNGDEKVESDNKGKEEEEKGGILKSLLCCF